MYKNNVGTQPSRLQRKDPHKRWVIEIRDNRQQRSVGQYCGNIVDSLRHAMIHASERIVLLLLVLLLLVAIALIIAAIAAGHGTAADASQMPCARFDVWSRSV